MLVTGWASQTSYGIRIGAANRDRYFDTSWKSVAIEVDGAWYVCPITAGFWNNCPEIRHTAFGAFWKRHGLAPWPRYQPPTARLVPLGGTRFRLTDARHADRALSGSRH